MMEQTVVLMILETRALKLRSPRNLRPNTSVTNPSPSTTLIVDWTAPSSLSTSFSPYGSLNLPTGSQYTYELRIVDSDDTELATGTNINLTNIFSQLASGTTYTIYVKSTLGGYGDSSEISRSFTTTIPASPNITDVEYNGSTGSLTVTWNQIVPHDSATYQYYVSVFPDQEEIISSTNSSITLDGVNGTASFTRTIDVEEDSATYLEVGVRAVYSSLSISNYDIERRALKLRTPTNLRENTSTTNPSPPTTLIVDWSVPSSSSTSFSPYTNLNLPTGSQYTYELRIVDSDDTEIGTGTNINLTNIFSQLSAGTTYTIYVKTTLGGYGYSDELSGSFTTDTPNPPNITDVEYNGSNGSLTVTWNEILPLNSATYEYYVSVFPDQEDIITVSTSSIESDGINNTASFTRTIDVTEDSAEYLEVGVRSVYSGLYRSTYDIERRGLKLRTPTNLRPNTSITNPSPTNTLIVDWSAPSSLSTNFSPYINLNLPTGSQYTYELRLTDSDDTEIGTGTNINLTNIFSQLSAGTTYTIYVKTTLGGYGDSYEISRSFTTAVPAPPNITDVEYNGSNGSLTVTWNQILPLNSATYEYYVSTFNSEGVESELITVSTSSIELDGINSTASFTRTIDIDEDSDVYLEVGVRAVYGTNRSTYDIETRALKLRTPSNLRPNTSVTNPSPTTTLIVDWNAPTLSTSFSPYTNLNLPTGSQYTYELRIVDSDDTELATGTNINLTNIFSQLASGTTYTIYVKSTLGGYGDSSEISRSFTTEIPEKPDITDVEYNGSTGSLTVTWNQILPLNSATYEYYVSTFNSEGVESELITVSTSSIELDGINNTASFTVTIDIDEDSDVYLEVGVRAVYSSVSISLYDKERRGLKLRTPTNLRLNDAITDLRPTTIIAVNWNSGPSRTSAGPNYGVLNLPTGSQLLDRLRIVDSDGTQIGTATSVSSFHSFSQLNPGTTYTIYVKSTFGGYSDSDELSRSFTTDSLIVGSANITSITYDGSTGNLTFNWNGAANAIGYRYDVDVFPNQLNISTGDLGNISSHTVTIDVNESTAQYLEVGVRGLNDSGQASNPIGPRDSETRALRLQSPTVNISSESVGTVTLGWTASNDSTLFSTHTTFSSLSSIEYKISTSINPTNNSPTGITVINDRIYIPDWSDDAIFIYDLEGNCLLDESFYIRNPSFNLNNQPAYTPLGIDISGSTTYILDGARDNIERYQNGVRVGHLDLNSANDDGRGISVTSNRIYVVDRNGSKIYVYNLSGTRQTSEEFDLHVNNGNAQGISVTSSRVYIVDFDDDRIYVYNLSGTRQTSEEFNLHSSNGNPTGISVTSTRVYVIDFTDNRVYVYNLSGTRQISEEFILDKNSNFTTTSTSIDFITPSTSGSFTVSIKATLEGYGDSEEGDILFD